MVASILERLNPGLKIVFRQSTVEEARLYLSGPLETEDELDALIETLRVMRGWLAPVPEAENESVRYVPTSELAVRAGVSVDKVEAVLTLAARSRFTLAECEELAKDTDTFNSMTFDLVGPKGRKPCKWVDAYYGIFELDGGAFQSAQFKYAHDLHCENLSFPDATA